MTNALLIIAIWFGISFLVGPAVGRFLHGTENNNDN
jgi:hypothetical protein